MDETDLEVSGDIEEPELESEDDTPVRKPFWALPFLGLFFLLFAVFLLIFNNAGNGSDQNTGPTEALLSYQNLSSEMNTGIRLARLDDFLAQHADSPLQSEVIARRDALKQHEEKAWAVLTDAFYHTDADDAAKAAAIEAYTDVWTPLHRPEQLKTLDQILPDDAIIEYDPNARKSRFASGGNDQFLEGAPIVRTPVRPRVLARNTMPERINPSRIVQPRIRKKRSPSYPSKAKRRRIEADVVLELDIDDRGRVARARVISVRADRYAKDFAKSAQRAARRTRFHPKTIGGRPVAMSGYVQRYSFRYSR